MSYENIKTQMAELSLRELLALREQIGDCIAVARDREVDLLIDQASALEAEGISVRYLLGKLSAVEAKYRDPTTGKTWSGRGKKPGWVVNKLAEGGSLDDLKIAV